MTKINDQYFLKKDDGWAVKAPGAKRSSGDFDTQRQAEQRAKEIVEKKGGGEVRIKGATVDGSIATSVSPGNDPNPPKERSAGDLLCRTGPDHVVFDGDEDMQSYRLMCAWAANQNATFIFPTRMI